MKKRLVALLLILVILVPCVASAAGWYRLTDKKRIFNLPDYNSQVLDTYRQDWALYVSGSVNKTWARVTFSNGVTGYLEKKFLSRDSSYSAWISTSSASLKHGPGSSFRNEATLSKGAKVSVLTTGSSYSFVESDAGFGYIANGALSRSKVTGSGSSYGKSVSYTAWVVSRGDPVGLRQQPSSASAAFETYYPGTAVTVLMELGDFWYVRMANGHEGYMRSKYLSKVKPAKISDKAAADSIPTGAAPVAPGEVQLQSEFPFTAVAVSDGAGNSPRVFKGEGLGWSSDVVNVGATVIVVGGGSDIHWFRVQVNGISGYMPSKFIIR